MAAAAAGAVDRQTSEIEDKEKKNYHIYSKITFEKKMHEHHRIYLAFFPRNEFFEGNVGESLP